PRSVSWRCKEAFQGKRAFFTWQASTISDNIASQNTRFSGRMSLTEEQRTAYDRRTADDRDGARLMTKFDGELSPPFEIVEPASWRAPIIFNSPHSGSVYPSEFLNASRIDPAALRRSGGS